jgi:hypothetical protein
MPIKCNFFFGFCFVFSPVFRGKSDPVKVSKLLKSDPSTTNFGFCHLNGQEFSFDADLNGGGEKSMLVGAK